MQTLPISHRQCATHYGSTLLAFIITLMFLVSACGGSTSSTTGNVSNTTTTSKKTIAFVMGAEADPFFKAMRVGAEAEAQAKDVNLIWQGDPISSSPATEITYVDQVLAQHPNGLVLIPTDPTALQPEVTKAASMNIPVINVDTEVADLSHVLSYIFSDNMDGGAKAADAMATAMNYQPGKTYKVVIGLDSPTITADDARAAGFEREIFTKYPGIRVVNEAYSQSQASIANTHVSNWFTNNPDLNGIFAVDGADETSAAAALQAKGLVGKVALVGYDAYPANVALLKQKVFTALISQNPAAEAKLAIDDFVSYFSQNNRIGITSMVHLPTVLLTPNSSDADFQKYAYPS